MNRFLSAILILFVAALPAAAQLRQDVPSPHDWTGAVVKTQAPSRGLLGLQQFQMSHSYEMTMGSFAGQGYNQNYYTNTMRMRFNDRLTGRLDLSVAHSPFGQGLYAGDGPRFLVRNAELSYQMNANTHFQVRFSQGPGGFHPGMYGSRYYDRFDRGY